MDSSHWMGKPARMEDCMTLISQPGCGYVTLTEYGMHLAEGVADLSDEYTHLIYLLALIT